MKNIQEEIQEINDKITQEIRLNRAITASIKQNYSKFNQNLPIFIFNSALYSRNPILLSSLLTEYSDLKQKLSKGQEIPLSQLSVLLKSIEIEEKHLKQKYYRCLALSKLSEWCYTYTHSSLLHIKSKISQTSSSLPLYLLLILLIIVYLLLLP